MTAGEILQNARALADRIRERSLAARYDELRNLPADIVEEVRQAGILRMNMPKIWGGPEMTALEQIEVIEILSRADASVGWCRFIWCDSGIYSGYLDDAVAREMYPRLDMATSGWVYPSGQAHRVQGGYRMSGRWMFGSGCGHCDWLVAGCTVFEEDGEVAHDAAGRPLWRILYGRPDDYEIEDTWYTTGLRGTGSNDYRCTNLFVPEERSFSLFDPPRRAGTIWARPDQPVDHCKLTARLDREINFSLWLPDTWNGKFLMGGGGGYVGSIQNQALPRALEGGYATAGTDTGHQGAGTDAAWALHNLERIVNYGYLAMHRVAQVSKYVTARHYAAAPERSYFAGCSNGGRQGLIFAQRYPSEFDAIVSGAPAFDFAGLAAAFLHATMHVYPDIDDLSAPVLTRDDLTLLAEAVLARCDARDGLADGILNDPRDCDFDPGRLDLSPAKIAAIRAIYAGPRTADGPVHPGWSFGGEDQPRGWHTWLTGIPEEAPDGPPSRAFAFGVGFMRYMVEHDPDWTHEGMDFHGYRARTATAAAAINATDPDIDAFREAGGKLLLYHGWADAALSALATIDYVEQVYTRDPAARADVRLFMLPGVLHCQGGPGPWMVDYLGALERWDADGEAPDTLPAAFEDGSGARPLCAYPARAEYVGGSGKNPADFECR